MSVTEDAFCNCINIKSIYLGTRVKTLGSCWFDNVPFQCIYFRSQCTVKNIGTNIFLKNKNSIINVTYHGIDDIKKLSQIMRIMHSRYFSNANINYLA